MDSDVENGMGGIKISVSTTVEAVSENAKSKLDDHVENHTAAKPLNNLSTCVQKFLQPLKESILKAKTENATETQDDAASGCKTVEKQDFPEQLMKSLCHFIWEPDMIYVSKGFLQRTYNTLNYNFVIGKGQSDLEDFLEHKPSEIMAYKATQVFIALVLPDVDLFVKELDNFKTLMEDCRVARDGRGEAAYMFLYNVFKTCYEVLADELDGKDLNVEENIPDFEKLGLSSRCFVDTLSVIFLRLFRLKSRERLEKMKQVVKDDESSYEWSLYLAEILRLKRRESATSRPQWPTAEEMNLVAKVVSIAPDNPYVRLAVLDTIIGSVRDANGRFFCGDIHLENLDDAMRYLRENSEKLIKEYPNNVMFNSIISDYFARYVPLLYFDVDYSHQLLKAAYALNPFHPKTTHRLGILSRMSLGKLDESLLWFEKTIELDPTHYAATLEYVKSIMGNADKYDASQFIQSKLDSPESKGWSSYEISDLQFFLGIAHFIKGDKEETLKWWKKAAETNESQLTLMDLQDTFLFYEWDNRLVNSDKLRLWIKSEKDALASKAKASEPYDGNRQKFVERIFGLMLGRVCPTRCQPLCKYYEENMPCFPMEYLNYFMNFITIQPKSVGSSKFH